MQSQKIRSEAIPGYDIVLVLDESTSVSVEGIQQRNEAAKMLVHLLPDDCRLAALFFAGEVSVGYTNTFVSTSTESGKESLLTTFNRTERIPNGTNMNLAVKAALDLHSNDSLNEKVIILLTDGINHVVKSKGVMDEEKTKIVDNELRATVQKATEMGIPIYVIYIDDGAITANGQNEVAHICDLFNSKVYKSNDLEKGVTDRQNRVIHLAGMNELRNTFLSLFGALKNISYKKFTASESGIVDIPIPAIGATGVQIIAESNYDFTFEGMHNINNGQQLIGATAFKGGQPMVITYPDDGSRIDEGLYQIAFSGNGEITGSISIDTDFEAEITFSQSGNNKICRAMPTRAVINLVDMNGNNLYGGEKLSVVLIAEGVKYDATYDSNHYTAENILFDCTGCQPYTLDLNYDGIHYYLNGTINVCENDFGNGSNYNLAVPADYAGEAVEVCKLDEHSKYADVSKGIDVRVVSSGDSEGCNAYLSENNTIMLSNAAPKQKYSINVSFSDICGEKQNTTIIVSISKKLSSGVIAMEIFVCILLLIVIAVIVMRFIYGKQYKEAQSKIKSLHQEYKVEIETKIDDENATGYLVHMNSKTMSEHNAVRNIGDAVFFRNGKVHKLSEILGEETKGLKLMLCKDIPPVVYAHGRHVYLCSNGKLIECSDIIKTLLPLKNDINPHDIGEFFTYHDGNTEKNNCVCAPLSVGKNRRTQIEYNGRTYFIKITDIGNI